MKRQDKCPNCGFDNNDILMTNCVICKKPLPQVDSSKISNEDIVLSTGEWIGKVGDKHFQTTDNFNMWKSAFLKNKYLGLQIGGPDKGIVEISKLEISTIANKYLDILKSRSESNIYLIPVYNNLKNELNKKENNLISKLGGQKRLMLIILIIFIFFLIFFPIIMVLKIAF